MRLRGSASPAVPESDPRVRMMSVDLIRILRTSRPRTLYLRLARGMVTWTLLIGMIGKYGWFHRATTVGGSIHGFVFSTR